jgi:hypothetical protein
MARGTPAIQPRGDSIPAFTEQDVRDYVSRGVSLGRVRVLGQLTITQIVFTTIHELDRAHGERYLEANYPADMPICYVELSGTMEFMGPPGPRSSQRAPQGGVPGTAYMLFDARTGNHFVTGAPARARWD